MADLVGDVPQTPRVNRACGIAWDQKDIDKFLRNCIFLERSQCLIWIGGKSKGRGKTAWYGSFWISVKKDENGNKIPGSGKTVRSHKFYAVAILGLRPTSGQHIDHKCQDALCVRHLQCVDSLVNLQLVWLRKERDMFGYVPPKPTYQDHSKEAALPLTGDAPF